MALLTKSSEFDLPSRQRTSLPPWKKFSLIRRISSNVTSEPSKKDSKPQYRTQAGTTSYTYDARDQLTSDGTGTYAYAADGDLTTVTGPSGTTASTSDAYGQQGTQGNVHDALGRDTALTTPGGTTALAYEGTTGQTASDGTSSYTWTPGGTLTGIAPGTGVLDLTDHHTDLADQFTPSGTTLTGSRTYDPWGSTAASGGTLAVALGYQSQYTRV